MSSRALSAEIGTGVDRRHPRQKSIFYDGYNDGSADCGRPVDAVGRVVNTPDARGASFATVESLVNVADLSRS